MWYDGPWELLFFLIIKMCFNIILYRQFHELNWCSLSLHNWLFMYYKLFYCWYFLITPKINHFTVCIIYVLIKWWARLQSIRLTKQQLSICVLTGAQWAFHILCIDEKDRENNDMARIGVHHSDILLWQYSPPTTRTTM